MSNVPAEQTTRCVQVFDMIVLEVTSYAGISNIKAPLDLQRQMTTQKVQAYPAERVGRSPMLVRVAGRHLENGLTDDDAHVGGPPPSGRTNGGGA